MVRVHDLFDAATNPAEIFPHEGVTHLMFAPDDLEDAYAIRRWMGLKFAIEMAGGHVQPLIVTGNYGYPRDPLVVVGDTAYHPGQAPDGTPDYRALGFAPFLEHYHYNTMPLDTLPDAALDGGNILPYPRGGILFAGLDAFLPPTQAVLDAHTTMAHESGLALCHVESTCPHLDCVVGELPNGRVLAKIDESIHAGDLEELGLDDCITPLMGVTPNGVRALKNTLGPAQVITYSAFANPLADVVCGASMFREGATAARAFGMSANTIVVNNTLIGEALPPTLALRLEKQNIRHITPADVGADSFVFGDTGLAGGARCLTLPVRQRRLRIG